jgi:HK97 family phage major capsid protein
LTKEELDKLNKTLDENIEGIRTKISDLEKAKLDKSIIDSEIKPTIEAAQKQLDKMEAEIKGKVDELDIAFKRMSDVGRGDGAETIEQKTFKKWIRKGQDGLTDEEVKVMKLSDDTTGGYLSSPEVEAGLLKNIVEFSPIRSLASVRTIGRESWEKRRRSGTFSANWVTEVGARNETTGLTFGVVRIPTHEMAARVDSSRKDLEDTDFDMEAIFRDEFSEQFGVCEGTAFVTGNTTGQPEGILTNANVGSSNSGNTTALTADGFLTAYFTPKSFYVRGGDFAWLMRRATMAAAAKLKNNDNDYLLRRLGDTPGWTILGAPVVECPDVPAVANAAYPVIYGSIRKGYQIVDRAGMTILRDPFTAANTGTVIFHAYKRVGGKVIVPEAIYKMLIST